MPQSGREVVIVEAVRTPVGRGHKEKGYYKDTHPNALLDYVGLDVSKAIGESIGARVPDRLVELVGAGALGRKTGAGFYRYD